MEQHILEMVKRYEERVEEKEKEKEKEDEKVVTEESENMEGLGDAFLESNIYDGALEYEDCPVALVYFEGTPYLICINGEEGEIRYPMIYIERLVPGATEGENGLQIGFQSPYLAGMLMEDAMLYYRFAYILKASKPADQGVFKMYVEMVEKLKAQEAGIELPSGADISQVIGAK